MENITNEDIEPEKGDLTMNPFSFSGRSGRLNFLVYGIVLPLVIVGLGFFVAQPQIIIVSMLVGFIMALASTIRRGRDAGMTPVTTMLILILSSAIISTIMEKSFISLKLLVMFGNPLIGMIVIGIIQNIFLVYLLFAPKSKKEVPKTSKLVQIILGLFIALIVVGILLSIALPKLNQAKSATVKNDIVCIKMKSLKQSLGFYRLDRGSYPSTEEGLEVLVESLDSRSKPYLAELPKDVWGTPYKYYQTKDGNIELVSYGPDKKEASKDDIALSICK